MVHNSIATIKSPEFINLQSNEISPFITNCQIKVFYLGENRNGSSISKEVALEMAKTLRGVPIVGYYKEDKEDFSDHGDQIIIDGEGIKFATLTKPYGFVAPDAEVWFQDFEDMDERGVKTTRTYLVTNGYLWTGQFEECRTLLNNTKSQSMELDAETLKGEWTKAVNNDYELFIINDATFSKLCILGDDVEPCFEGASITTNQFAQVDESFKKTLFSMMQDLEKIVSERSKIQMDNPNIVEEVITEFAAVDEPAAEESAVEEEAAPAISYSELEQSYAALQADYDKLQNEYNDLTSKYSLLLDYKNKVEEAKKDELINSFYMLSDEDKADVIAHKNEYSYDDIESKLSVICVRKKVSFAEVEPAAPVTTFNLQDSGEESVPEWLAALRNTQKERNIY